MDISLKAKSGDKFLLEIVITKDCDMLTEAIGKSIYAKEENDRIISDCFKIESLLFYKSFDDYRKKIADKVKEMILKERF